MNTRNDDFITTLETIIDRISPKQLELLYNIPIMVDSTSPSLNVRSPTHNFDDIFIFSVFDRMMHYKLVSMEDSSSFYNQKEKCELKDNDIFECMKEIAVLQ